MLFFNEYQPRKSTDEVDATPLFFRFIEPSAKKNLLFLQLTNK